MNLSSSFNTSPLSKFKIVFLGDQAVGKTSIINKIMFDTFDSNEHPTIGIDFISKNLHYEDKILRLQLWDTAGQERFRTLIPGYIRDCAVAVIVYDVTSRSSFESLRKWVEDVKEQKGGDVLIYLVGNKIDLSNQRQLSNDEGRDLANELELIHFEVSAKSGQNVNTLFQIITKTLAGKEINIADDLDQSRQNNNIKIASDAIAAEKGNLKEKKNCC